MDVLGGSQSFRAKQSSAADVLKSLVPTCSQAVFEKLRKEHIITAPDLAGLDKGDLRELGLTMGQRNAVRRWAANFVSQAASPRRSHAKLGSDDDELLCEWSLPLVDEPRPFMRMMSKDELQAEQSLDAAEQQADFWCNLVLGFSPVTVRAVPSDTRNSNDVHSLNDVRENVLEELFDLSSERVRQLHEEMVTSCQHGCEKSEALRQTLKRCGCPDFDGPTLSMIIQKVGVVSLVSLAQFEAILSRLKLAQLLTGACRVPVSTDPFGRSQIVLSKSTVHLSKSSQAAQHLTVVDYDVLQVQNSAVSNSRFREFFFGHRPQSRNLTDLPSVRWIHMSGLDLTLLLALTVKYSLHPFSVEDAVEQCSTKIDQYGSHYFVAVEQLCLASAPTGTEPVRVHGRHVAIFCSGPPLLDTIITISEQDCDEKDDWPGVAVQDTQGIGEAWVFQLHQRLKSTHSRLRERRADFLMYQILDLCVDEYLKVTDAYVKRLGFLESQPHISGLRIRPSWMNEVSLAQMQLAVVARRLRSMQRLLRRALETPGFTSDLAGCIMDIKDHVDEAQEDVTLMMGKCSIMIQNSEREIERLQVIGKSRADDSLNKMVFFLTCATAIFAPVQLFAGVYGMNFQTPSGRPTIPELLMPYGYDYFWLGTILYLVLSIAAALCCYRRFQQQQEHVLHDGESEIESETDSTSSLSNHLLASL